MHPNVCTVFAEQQQVVAVAVAEPAVLVTTESVDPAAELLHLDDVQLEVVTAVAAPAAVAPAAVVDVVVATLISLVLAESVATAVQVVVARFAVAADLSAYAY